MRPCLFALLLVCVLGCNRNRNDILPDANSTVVDVNRQPNWRTEPIDATYAIQFPSTYRGGIGSTIEGPEFSLQKKDGKVYFLAPYHIALSGGGDVLPTPVPSSIPYLRIALDRTVTFRRDGQTQGIFYYVQQPQPRGHLYLLKNGQLRYSLLVQYSADLHREVLGILQTIQPQ